MHIGHKDSLTNTRYTPSSPFNRDRDNVLTFIFEYNYIIISCNSCCRIFIMSWGRLIISVLYLPDDQWRIQKRGRGYSFSFFIVYTCKIIHFSAFFLTRIYSYPKSFSSRPPNIICLLLALGSRLYNIII